MNDKIRDKLSGKSEKNFRLTKIRLSILECLSDGHHSHSIKNIIDHLESKNIKVNVSSVYNTIKFLISKGIIEINNNFDTKEQTYEIINKDNLHAHLYNVETNQTIEIPLPKSVKVSIENFLNSKNLVFENIKLEIVVKDKK